MKHEANDSIPLSAWWRHATILVMVFGFAVLSFVTVQACMNAPERR